ncbi:MAG: leucine-rich repeat domain-containing protein [Clostridia bacterium]|nr:leucine-rich repeat domain-containing protein [Clostridia bacterium]
MKKGKLKKIIAATAMGFCALAMPFMLTGCDKDDDINVRFNDNYFQWQIDGEDDWNNLFTIDEIRELLGEGYKGNEGAQGNPGSDGREVEFQTTNTHIQWRYVTEDNSDSWKNLVALSEIKGNSGTNGTSGEDGLTPYIGENGNWWIGTTDTGVKAEGAAGTNGTNGINGVDGREVVFRTTETHIQWRYETEDNSDSWKNLIELSELKGQDGTNGSNGVDGFTPYIGENGNWWIGSKDSGVKAKGEDGDQYIIGEDGYWYLNGVKTEFKAIGQDVSYETYTITYDYGYAMMTDFFDNYKESETIRSNQWLTDLPSAKNNFPGEFDGWYIKDTNKKIENYDFIGGDLVLEARWNSLISGLYLDGVCVKSWDQIIADFPDAFNESCTSIVYYRNSDNPYEYIWYMKGDLIIDDSITTIGNRAFVGCFSLTSVIIPSSVTSIGIDAFKECNSLTAINIPENVSEIDEDVAGLWSCDNLKNIRVDNNNSVYDSREYCNGIIETATNTLIFGRETTVIPKSVENIGDKAFYMCLELTSFVIPNNIKCIGNNTFNACENLKKIDIPISVTSIGAGAFANCDNLESIEIPESVTSLGTGVFYGCSSLKDVIIPPNVKNLPSRMFEICSELKTIVIYSTVTSIGADFIAGCNKIEKVIFKGTRDQWDKIEINEDNYNLLHITNLIKFEPETIE